VGYPVVVKAQVKVGDAAKAGGVKLAQDETEVRLHAGNILGLDIKGHVVHRLWIERSSDIAKEYYASFTLDRPNKVHLGMLSAQGGVEIEVVAEQNPKPLRSCRLTRFAGSIRDRSSLGRRGGIDEQAREQTAELLVKLYDCYTTGDCDLAESTAHPHARG